MNKLFRPKCMRRMAVFMALVAPIIYLFGSLFFALNGAHGTQVFAQEVTNSYEYSFQVEYGHWINSDGSDVGLSGTYLTNTIALYDSSSLIVDYSPVGGNKCIVACYDSNGFVTRLEQNAVSSPLTFDVNGVPYVRVGVSYTVRPESVSLSVSSLLTSNGIEDLKNVSYSDYVFGHFFDADNFLVEWGENAISENPYGFAPFGYFWRYLDTNVLHMSNEQVGLMAYGYMYYAAHVLLFDVGFILVTFFLTFIQKVADKIGGEDHA